MKYEDILQAQIIPPRLFLWFRKPARMMFLFSFMGEQGVGKEWVAKAIHQLGEEKYHRFYKIDCKMLKEETLLPQISPLFKEIRYGAIPATLFLKEVGTLGPADQLKLLEWMEEGFFQDPSGRETLKTLRPIPPPPII